MSQQEAPYQVKLDLGGRTLILESGKIAKQANGAVVARYADSIVLCTACMSSSANDRDFLPLTVDYREYTYSAGKIPGGFFKREGRPSEREILISRLIDRPMRPLFPEAWRNETQIVGFVLSMDENDPDVLAVTAASAAAYCSDLPFTTPIAAVRVGMLDGQSRGQSDGSRTENEFFQHRHRGQRRSDRDGGGGRARSLRGQSCGRAGVWARAIKTHRRRHSRASRADQAEESGSGAAGV